MLLPQLLPWDPVTHPALTPVHHQPMRRERRRPSHESITRAVCKEVVTDATSHRPPDIGSYLAEAPRLHVLAAYLRHETGKHNGLLYIAPVEVVASRTSEGHATALTRMRQLLSAGRSIDEQLAAMTIDERWVVFHAVSSGCLLKELENCVAHPSFSWHLEKRQLREMILQSRVGPLAGSGEGPAPFLEAVSLLGDLGGDEVPHALGDPLIGRETAHGVLVHDGNGRLLSRAYAVRDGQLSHRATIEVWVARGRPVQAADQTAYDMARRTLFVTRGQPAH